MCVTTSAVVTVTQTQHIGCSFKCLSLIKIIRTVSTTYRILLKGRILWIEEFSIFCEIYNLCIFSPMFYLINMKRYKVVILHLFIRVEQSSTLLMFIWTKLYAIIPFFLSQTCINVRKHILWYVLEFVSYAINMDKSKYYP